MKKPKEMSLTELLIAWDESKRKLEEVKSPEYINKRIKEIFGEHQKTDYTKEINDILKNL